MRAALVFSIAPAAAFWLACGAAGSAGSGADAATYYPGPDGAWERRAPAEVGLDAAALQEAVTYASTHETDQVARDFSRHESKFGPALGPLPESRAGSGGVIVKDGYIVAEWGDTRKVDLMFSATKSFVSTMVGLAYDAGLIESVTDPVGKYVHDGSFDSPHNAKITWQQLLQQTSEWEGELFGKADTADFYHRRGRTVGRQEPGTYWEYNDIRVNLAAYAALRVWKTSLPAVLKARVMDPIGASDTWVWHGYRTSDVEIDGQVVKSVSGGGHWGGGLWMNALDMARFGYLFLRRGVWDGQRIISEEWIDLATTPTDIRPVYGYMWWLTPDTTSGATGPARIYAARGHGGNTIWIDTEHDLVVVTRWFGGEWDEFQERIHAALLEDADVSAD